MMEMELVSENLPEINHQYCCQRAKFVLNSVAVKASRHLYSNDVSLKFFNDTQLCLNENVLLSWTATITAIFTENKMTWVCSASAFIILQQGTPSTKFILHNTILPVSVIRSHLVISFFVLCHLHNSHQVKQ